MKTATKKITSLLFILLGFTPLLFVLYFTVKQELIRHHMKERMKEQFLHTITLADAEIKWAKEGKEIWVQDKLFDIKSFEHKDGTTTFHGLYDDEETILKKNFNEACEKNRSEQNLLLAQLFQSLQCIYNKPATDIPVLPDKQHHLSILLSPKLLTQFKTIPTPPPQV